MSEATHAAGLQFKIEQLKGAIASRHPGREQAAVEHLEDAYWDLPSPDGWAALMELRRWVDRVFPKRP